MELRVSVYTLGERRSPSATYEKLQMNPLVSVTFVLTLIHLDMSTCSKFTNIHRDSWIDMSVKPGRKGQLELMTHEDHRRFSQWRPGAKVKVCQSARIVEEWVLNSYTWFANQ